jgi:hypothetical protein
MAGHQSTPPWYPYNSARPGQPLTGSQLPPPPPPPPPPRPGNTVPGMSQPFAYSYSYGGSSLSKNPPPGYAAHTPTLPVGLLPSTTAPHQAATTTDDPESKRRRIEWTCDACELSLDSEQALKSHRKSHVKCTVCSFEAAPKVVKGHFQSVHGKFSVSGFKTVTIAVPGCRVQRFKICVGSRPEDIQKWIADRKKRFPRVQQQQRQEDSAAACETKTNTDAKPGLSTLLAGYGSSSGSDDDENGKGTDGGDKKVSAEKGNPTTDDQPLVVEEESPKPKQSATASDGRPQRSARPCRYFMRNGTCLNGDACRFSHDVSRAMNSNSNNANSNKNSAKRGGKQSSSSDTLLRKLLANDMRRETTLALQLLRYIVDCNFLQEKRPAIQDQEPDR